MMKDTVIAWWSGGVTSAVACYWAIKVFKKVEIVFLDTKGNEDDDTYRFLEDCKKLYNQKIVFLSNPEYETIEDVWDKYGYLNTAHGAICSTELKRKMREQYQDLEKHFGQVFGFEYEKTQINRHLAMRRNYPEINVISPLIDLKMNKEDCASFFSERNIPLPIPYIKGYQNNNCHKTGCVQGGIGYWQKIQKDDPEKFKRMAMREHKYTNLAGEPRTICKDQSENGGLVFLMPHPDYPDIKDISMLKGKKVQPLQECFGFCSTKL